VERDRVRPSPYVSAAIRGSSLIRFNDVEVLREGPMMRVQSVLGESFHQGAPVSRRYVACPSVA